MMVGIPRRKENSAAKGRVKPRNTAPMMVEAERDIPGHIARHWKRPTPSAKGMVICLTSATLKSLRCLLLASAIKIRTAPVIKATATLMGLNRRASIQSSINTPITAAGRNAIKISPHNFHIRLFFSLLFPTLPLRTCST